MPATSEVSESDVYIAASNSFIPFGGLRGREVATILSYAGEATV